MQTVYLTEATLTWRTGKDVVEKQANDVVLLQREKGSDINFITIIVSLRFPSQGRRPPKWLFPSSLYSHEELARWKKCRVSIMEWSE